MKPCFAIIVLIISYSCASGGTSQRGESSKPINQGEEAQYKRSLLRCYKTGGSRIVKIDGVLRCF